MRSPDDAKTKVRAVVTWVELNEEYSADEVLDSQCRSIDPKEFRMQDGFSAEGARRGLCGQRHGQRSRLGHAWPPSPTAR